MTTCRLLVACAIAGCGPVATRPASPSAEPAPPADHARPAPVVRVPADRAVVRGRVRAGGKPVRYFGVVLEAADRPGAPSPPIEFRAATGHFAVEHAAGTWDVIVVGPGFASRRLAGITLANGRVRELGDVDVEPGFTIEGDVVDGAGRAVSDARVTLTQRPAYGDQDVLSACYDGNLATRTDVDGHYRFTGVSAAAVAGGKPQLRATHDRYGASYPVSSRLGNGSVKLVVVPAGAIAGAIEVPVTAGALVTAASISQPGIFLIAFVDDDARFRFDRIPAGDYDLSFGGLRQKVTVVPDQDTPIAFTP